MGVGALSCFEKLRPSFDKHGPEPDAVKIAGDMGCQQGHLYIMAQRNVVLLVLANLAVV